MSMKQSNYSAKSHHLFQDIRDEGTWAYLVNYLLIGSMGLIILLETIQHGIFIRLGAAIAFFVFAVFNLSRINSTK